MSSRIASMRIIVLGLSAALGLSVVACFITTCLLFRSHRSFDQINLTLLGYEVTIASQCGICEMLFKKSGFDLRRATFSHTAANVHGVSRAPSNTGFFRKLARGPNGPATLAAFLIAIYFGG